MRLEFDAVHQKGVSMAGPHVRTRRKIIAFGIITIG